MRNLLIILLVLIAVFEGVGILFLRSNLTAAANVASPLPSKSVSLADPLPRAESQQRIASAVPSVLETPSGIPTENLRTLLKLKKSRQIDFEVSLLDDDQRFNGAIGELLGLTPTEVVAVGAQVDRARNRMIELLRAKSTISKDEKGVIKLHQDVMLNEGGAIHDDLIQGLEAAIGPAKSADLFLLMGERIEKTFDDFGSTERNMTITPKSFNGKQGFQFVVEYKGAGKSGTMRTEGTDAQSPRTKRSLGLLYELVFPPGS